MGQPFVPFRDADISRQAADYEADRAYMARRYRQPEPGRDYVVEGEIEPHEAESIFIEDRYQPDATRHNARGTRLDRVGYDQSREIIKLDGPYGRISGRDTPPIPLPLVLVKLGIEAGAWIAVHGYYDWGGDHRDYPRRYLRVTSEVLERGRELLPDYSWYSPS